MSTRKLFHAYFKQLTEGCGKLDCKNPFCATAGTPLAKNVAAAEAIKLISTKNDTCLCEHVNAAETSSSAIVAETPVAASSATPGVTATADLAKIISADEAGSNTIAADTAELPPSNINDVDTTDVETSNSISANIVDTPVSSTSNTDTVDPDEPDSAPTTPPPVAGVTSSESSSDSKSSRSSASADDCLADYAEEVSEDATTPKPTPEPVIVPQELTLTQVTQLLDMATVIAQMDDIEKVDAYADFCEVLDEAFSSVAGISNCFLTEDGAPATPTHPGVDVESLCEALKQIVATDELLRTHLSSAVHRTALELSAMKHHKIEELRAFLVIGAFASTDLLMFDASMKHNGILYGLSHAVCHLSAHDLAVLKTWFCKVLTPELFRRLVSDIQHYLTMTIYTLPGPPPKLYKFALPACRLLRVLHGVGAEAPWREEIQSYHDLFYNDAINLDISLRADFRRWMSQSPGFCDYPFVLTASSKAHIMHLDAVQQMRRAAQAEFDIPRLFSHGQPLSPYLVLNVNRSNVVHDTLEQIHHLQNADLKKALKVKFKNEEGVDEGGLAKEFFQIIMADLFDRKYAMFTTSSNGRCYWFNGNTFEPNMKFELIGVLMGIAIFNRVILDLHFPMIAYGKILGRKPTIESLEEYMPEIAKNLRKILECKDPDEISDMELTMTWHYESYGSIVTVPLKDGGEDIKVTVENSKEYVDLVVDFILTKSMKPQFDAFKLGFLRVCQQRPLQLFQPHELERAICGSHEMNFEELEANAKYDDGYYEGHRVIRDFWAVFHDLTLEEKKKLLMFATGSDRAPVDGLKSLKLTISRSGPDSDRLPSSHTCFNHLLLPEYNSREKLRRCLLVAISHSKGFGLM